LLRREEFGNVTSRLPWDSNLPRLIRCLLIVAASAVMNSSAQALPTFDQIVVFGDSLSDNGNAGRASNGAVWVEHLATRFGFMLEPDGRVQLCGWWGSS
jgi:outer membrane lipase/esterase